MELIMGIISAISAWGVFSFLRADVKKQRTNNTITKTEISKSIIETYPFTQIDKNHKENGIDEKVHWEQFDFYRAIVRKAQGNYRITYTDQCGLTTERNISISRVYDKDNKFALDARCHLHNVHRSFINDGIQKAVDTETGEVIENVAQHAIAQYENSREGKVWSAIGREVDALDILIFICRADGRMLKAESEIIADYLKRRCSDLIFEERELDDAIKSLGTIDHHQFKRTIAEMKSSGDFERLRDMTNCAKRIVAIQKTIDPFEKASIEILEAAINSSSY